MFDASSGKDAHALDNEDTDCTIDDLREMGLGEEILSAIALLTHDPSVPYMDYVAQIKENPIALLEEA